MQTRALIAVLLLPSAVFACVWLDGTTLDGRIQRRKGVNLAEALRHVMEEKPWLQTTEAKFGKVKNKGDADAVEEQAVKKILTGETRAAIEMLQDSEKRWPGRYSTAANLGTAYELSRDNENALKWISTGIERNGQSHYGTEWLHVLILKTKLEAEKHPKTPLPSRMLNLPEQFGDKTLVNVDGKDHSISEIREALAYQLNERMLFVKPKDVYVADLLYSLAVIQANIDSVEAALDLLKLSRQYGFVDEPLLQRREQQYATVLAATKKRR